MDWGGSSLATHFPLCVRKKRFCPTVFQKTFEPVPAPLFPIFAPPTGSGTEQRFAHRSCLPLQPVDRIARQDARAKLERLMGGRQQQHATQAKGIAGVRVGDGQTAHHPRGCWVEP